MIGKSNCIRNAKRAADGERAVMEDMANGPMRAAESAKKRK